LQHTGNDSNGFMRYKKIIKGKFVSRPNRFIARVEIEGREEMVHVKNTGRCRELLIPGVTVYLEESDNPNRKTKYDLVTVEKLREGKPPLMINMDSQIPNDVAEEWLKKGKLFSKNAVLRREVKFGNSRFDFYVEDGERKAFVEVKGVTLEENGIAMFPDAPTERGVKHIKELEAAKANGFEAYVLFIIQMKGICKFKPNDETHKAFGDALRSGINNGVKILALDCIVKENSIEADNDIEVCLS